MRSAYPSITQNNTNAIDLDRQGQSEKKEIQEQRRDRKERALLAFKIHVEEHVLKKDETSAKDSGANKKSSSPHSPKKD